MEHLTFKEVLQRGFKTVVVQSYGYEEGRVCPTWQPFKNKINITFRVVSWGDDGYLENKVYFLKEDESKLDYYIKDNVVYVDDPLLGADIDY